MESVPRKQKRNRNWSLPKQKIQPRVLFPRTLSTEKTKKNVEGLEKARKFSKKTSFTELVIKSELKKSQSFEENPEKMPETGLFLVKPAPKNATVKKALASQIKRDFEKNRVNDETHDFERLSYFYRHRVASLLKTLGFQKQYTKAKNTKMATLKKTVFIPL